MVDVTDESLSETDCELLVERVGARVVIRRATKKVFDALDDRQKGRLKGIAGKWCESPGWLTKEMFNPNEGRTSRHKIMLQAIKIKAVRLYGFAWPLGNKKTFIIADADPVKKQKKADPVVLNRAKARVDDLIDLLNTKGF